MGRLSESWRLSVLVIRQTEMDNAQKQTLYLNPVEFLSPATISLNFLFTLLM
jgi:hypothetical protein